MLGDPQRRGHLIHLRRRRRRSSPASSTASGDPFDGSTGDPCDPDTAHADHGHWVYAPNGVDPLYHALVYVTSAVGALTDGVACLQCAEIPGNPAVTAITITKGRFTLDSAPCGADIPCRHSSRQVAPPDRDSQGRLLRHDLPRRGPNPPPQERERRRLAAHGGRHGPGRRGGVRVPQDRRRRRGVQRADADGGTGHVQLYRGDGASGAGISGALSESALWGSAATLNQYDLVFFACQGLPSSSARSSPTRPAASWTATP